MWRCSHSQNLDGQRERVWGVKGVRNGFDSLTEESMLWSVAIYRIRDIYRVTKNDNKGKDSAQRYNCGKYDFRSQVL